MIKGASVRIVSGSVVANPKPYTLNPKAFSCRV